MKARGAERGSIMLFTMFVCVAVAVLVQTLGLVVLCSQRGREAEAAGREFSAARVAGLAEARERLVAQWSPGEVPRDADDPGAVAVRMTDVAGSGGWALDVSSALDPTVSPISLSAWAERGRDGLDLPLAGVVAESATWVQGRTLRPVIETGGGPEEAGDGGAEGAREGHVWFRTVPAGWESATGAPAETLPRVWGLDEGWRLLMGGAAGVGQAAGVIVLMGEEGSTVTAPAGWGSDPAQAGLLLLMGGGTLDATGLGERWGVVVADGGDVRLDGTRLHGAVFASGSVDFGVDGVVDFHPSVVRHATDQALVRVRLVPGSRRETISGG